ncbi:MAG: DUF177 domain-containing protein [Chlorobi bacterium]|nr:DUF177 domain-containing protein [Chlorobiota bacterium]
MKYLKELLIPFKGLNLGVHQYNWEIDKRFFEEVENSEIHDAKLSVDLKFEKQERMFVLQFAINGHIVVDCDRCLDDLEYPVKIEQTVFVKFGEEDLDETEEIIVIPETDYQFDVSSNIYEFVVLSLPMRKVHGEDENGGSLCNIEMLDKVNEYARKQKADPRWDKLKNLKLDN